MRPTFYEDDEPVADVVAAFDRGQPALTSPPLPARLRVRDLIGRRILAAITNYRGEDSEREITVLDDPWYGVTEYHGACWHLDAEDHSKPPNPTGPVVRSFDLAKVRPIRYIL